MVTLKFYYATGGGGCLFDFEGSGGGITERRVIREGAYFIF